MLAIPQLLDELVAAGRWPGSAAAEIAQNLKALVPPERVRRLAAEEDNIYLFRPPFHTVRDRSKTNDFWISEMADPAGIDFDLALDMGDFGMGSDAPIVLDYRKNLANPRVIRLRWPRDGDPCNPNRWVVMSPDFASFVESLGL